MMKLQGFSLLELLVVLTIISVISSLSIPMLNNFAAKDKVQIASHQIKQALRYARTESILKHERIVVCPSIDGALCDLEGNGIKLLVYSDDTRELMRVLDLPETISVNYRGFNPMYLGIAYDSTGLAQNNGTYSVMPPLNNSLPKQKIIVSKTGRVRTEAV